MKSILLVDDETILCAELERTLESFGFDVLASHSVEAALRSIRQAAFDAAIVEFNIRSENRSHPRSGSGLQLVRRFHSAGMTIPILIYTAMAGENYEKASFDAGADDFVEMAAVTVDVFVARLQSHIRRHEQARV